LEVRFSCRIAAVSRDDAQLAARNATEPQPVIRSESLVGIVGAYGELLGTGKGGLRFLRAEPSRPRHRPAVAGLESVAGWPKRLLAWRPGALSLALSAISIALPRWDIAS
jgi:hypothetical protein